MVKFVPDSQPCFRGDGESGLQLPEMLKPRLDAMHLQTEPAVRIIHGAAASDAAAHLRKRRE